MVAVSAYCCPLTDLAGRTANRPSWVEIGPSSVLSFGHLMEPKPTFGDDGFSPRPRVTLAAKGYRRM